MVPEPSERGVMEGEQGKGYCPMVEGALAY